MSISTLAERAWSLFRSAEDSALPFLVRPSMPILFFGDSKGFLDSSLKKWCTSHCCSPLTGRLAERECLRRKICSSRTSFRSPAKDRGSPSRPRAEPMTIIIGCVLHNLLVARTEEQMNEAHGATLTALAAVVIALFAAFFVQSAKNDNYRLQRDVRRMCAVIVSQIGEYGPLSQDCFELGE